MKKIRIGNDIVIKWRITVNGEEVNLEGLDLSLYISTTYQPRKQIAFEVAGNEITATYKGVDQKVTGVYRLTLYRNEGENAQSILDACDAFELVSCSCLTVDAAFGGAEVELPVADLGIGVPGLSAYEIAVSEGFVGTQAEWLASLSAASEAAAAECREVIAEFSQAEDSRVTAEAQRVANENNRIAGEGSRVEAENDRAAAEQLRATAESKRDTAELARIANESNRVSAEGARSSAEGIRMENEKTRLADEETRVQSEAARVTAESKRANAEAQRETAEADRRAAELVRIGNETARQTAEQDRMNAESARKTAEYSRETAEDARIANESTRQTNEQARAAAETLRESAETDRADAEQARVEAEAQRAEEFTGFTATLANKEDAANKVTSINADADDVHYPSAKAVKDSIAKVKNIEVNPDMLSESTKQFINASGGGTITNFADDEDLKSVDNALKLADKTYDPITYSGMGRKYLRKNLVGGKNILTQEMLPSANTIYIIQYDYDLNGATITIPENCVLFFNGGKIQNGSLIYSNTLILGNIYIDCTCTGAIKNDYATPEMYGYNGGDLYNSLQSAINSNPFVKIKAGDYTLRQTIRVPSNRKIIGYGKVLIKSEIPAYDFAKSPFKDGSIVNVAMFALRGIEEAVDYSEFSSTSGDFLCGAGTALTSGTYKSNYLDVADASGFAEGDVILVSEGLGYWHYVTQEIAEIASISGNRINLKNPLRYQYSVGTDSIGNFFKNFANPEQPVGEQPILADFVACGIRKIKPVENVVIRNIILDTSTEGATSKLGLFATLSKNVLFDNIRMPKGRFWMTDSQDVVYNACSTGETNSYAGNGSNHIVYKDCVFTGGLQIEEGASDVAINNSLILSTSTPFSIIAHCKNIIISHCNIVGEYTNNVAAVSNKCKNITFIGCSIKGGSTAFRYYGSSFMTAYPDATDYSANKELTEYYDSTINLLASSFVGATYQKSIYNEHTSAKISIISVISRNGIYGNYEGAFGATYSIANIDVSDGISINGGKNAIIGLLQSSAQLNPATYVVNGRGAWGGESNGGGASVEGSQHWTAIGCRNGGANGKLMQNGYDFGIFHPNNTQKLFYREGTESTYHPILSDNNGLSCTSSDRPTASHRALGVCYFDTTLNKPIWWNGSAWVDATGAEV